MKIQFPQNEEFWRRIAEMEEPEGGVFACSPEIYSQMTKEFPMTVRAKFKVVSTSQREHWNKDNGPIHEIELHPVTTGSEENAAFYAATPSGVIKLGTINDEAAKYFKLGAQVYVDFTEAE